MTLSQFDPARRALLRVALSGIAAFALPGRVALASPPEITVYRSQSCECCQQWIGHMQAGGFRVRPRLLDDLQPIKRRLGVPAHLQSCHTAVIDSYVIEGHVPAAEVTRILIEQPSARGLAVPEMPIGSPGMEQPNGQREHYVVILFADGGRERVYARY